MMPRSTPPDRRTLRGVTLIELMVGMAIGLLATLVITQVALVFEGQKRTTTSGSDAQVNGALALQTLQRDIQASGYGLTSGGMGSCATIQGKRVGMSGVKTWDMAPAVITDGGASGAPDTVRVLMSSQSGFALPMRVFDQHTLGATQFGLNDGINIGNQVGDLMLAVPPAGLATPCSLFSISAIPTTTKTVSGVATTVTDRFIEHTAGANPSQAWNQDPVAGTTVFPGNVSTDVSYPDGSYLINLGKLIDRTYRLDTTTHVLMIDTFDSTVATASPTDPTSSIEMIPNVASLQAIYGIDSNADRLVDSWSNTVPTKTVGATVMSAWEQVIALRIAVVIRSAQPEKDEVTLTAPIWHPDGVTAADIDVSAGVTAWKHYRYKVFETTVPLRNMLWQS